MCAFRLMFQKHIQKFTNPRQIVRKLGECTYLLSDGKNWHASHLAHSVAPILEATDTGAVDLSFQYLSSSPPVPQASETLQRVSSRVRRPPCWLEDT